MADDMEKTCPRDRMPATCSYCHQRISIHLAQKRKTPKTCLPFYSNPIPARAILILLSIEPLKLFVSLRKSAKERRDLISFIAVLSGFFVLCMTFDTLVFPLWAGLSLQF